VGGLCVGCLLESIRSFLYFSAFVFLAGSVLVVEVLTWRAIENLQPLTQISSSPERHVVEGA